MSNRLTDAPEHLRLGIDLDGAVADFNAGWMARFDRDHGAALDPEHITGWEGLHDHAGFDSMDAFWSWARGGEHSIFRDLPVMPGAVEALARLAEAHRVVRRAGGPLHRGQGDHPLRRLLDDAPYQLEAFVRARSGATVCRAVRPWNVPVPGTVDVADWPAFEALVAELAARS